MITTAIISIVLLGQVSADEIYIDKLIKTEGLASDRIIPKYCSNYDGVQHIQELISVDITEKTYVSVLKEARQLFREEIASNKIDEQCLVWVVRLTYKYSKEHKRIEISQRRLLDNGIHLTESAEQAEINRLEKTLTEKQIVAEWISLTEEEQEWSLFYQSFKVKPIITCASILAILQWERMPRAQTNSKAMPSYNGARKLSEAEFKLSEWGVWQLSLVSSRYGFLIEPIIVTNVVSTSEITGSLQCQQRDCSKGLCKNSTTLEVWLETSDASFLQVGDKWFPPKDTLFAVDGQKQYQTALGRTATVVYLRSMKTTRTVDELVKIVPPDPKTISPVQQKGK